MSHKDTLYAWLKANRPEVFALIDVVKAVASQAARRTRSALLGWVEAQVGMALASLPAVRAARSLYAASDASMSAEA